MMTEKTNRPSAAVQQARQRFGIVGNAPALTAALERAVSGANRPVGALCAAKVAPARNSFRKSSMPSVRASMENI